MTHHPASCKTPDTCTRTYREHLLGFVIGANALPTRGVHRTPGMPDEPAWQTEARERRWDKDMPAFKRLCQDGLEPASIDGSAYLEATATSAAQIEGRPDGDVL
jgi:hypothetical protein